MRIVTIPNTSYRDGSEFAEGKKYDKLGLPTYSAFSGLVIYYLEVCI